MDTALRYHQLRSPREIGSFAEFSRGRGSPVPGANRLALAAGELEHHLGGPDQPELVASDALDRGGVVP